MGHQIGYMTVDRKSQVLAVAEEFARINGDPLEGSNVYHGDMEIARIEPIEGYDQALEWVKAWQDCYGSYHDVAVRFIDDRDGDQAVRWLVKMEVHS